MLSICTQYICQSLTSTPVYWCYSIHFRRMCILFNFVYSLCYSLFAFRFFCALVCHFICATNKMSIFWSGNVRFLFGIDKGQSLFNSRQGMRLYVKINDFQKKYRATFTSFCNVTLSSILFEWIILRAAIESWTDEKRLFDALIIFLKQIKVYTITGWFLCNVVNNIHLCVFTIGFKWMDNELYGTMIVLFVRCRSKFH